MSTKSDYFFLNIKQLYSTFSKPSALETEIWEEVLAPYSTDDIKRAIKSYRKNEESDFAPTPARLKHYLYATTPANKAERLTLPLSPEAYLMEQDIKAGRCEYFFPMYVKGVNYVLNEKLKEFYSKPEFDKLSRSARYRLAVENGLFAEFDKVLKIISKQEAQ